MAERNFNIHLGSFFTTRHYFTKIFDITEKDFRVDYKEPLVTILLTNCPRLNCTLEVDRKNKDDDTLQIYLYCTKADCEQCSEWYRVDVARKAVKKQYKVSVWTAGPAEENFEAQVLVPNDQGALLFQDAEEDLNFQPQGLVRFHMFSATYQDGIELVLGGNVTRNFRFPQGQLSFVIHGWQNNLQSDFCQITKNALLAKGHVAVVVDWGSVARNLYTIAT